MYKSRYGYAKAEPKYVNLGNAGQIIEHLFVAPKSDIPNVSYEVRNQHIYIPGKTRHGKSTLIFHLALKDILNGAGVCVIDPKGDLVSQLIHWIPESRKDDCIYIDPHKPVPVNFLDYETAREQQTLVGELKHVITKGVSTEGAPLMNSMLNDVIYTLLDAKEHDLDPAATFLDIHDFLAFPRRKDEILLKVKSPRYQARWSGDNWPNSKDRQPTLTRMNDFISSKYLRDVLGCPKPKITVSWIMDNRKILLVNLGGIDEPSQLFATMLIAKIHQTAKRRGTDETKSESQRIPFHLYADEFQLFQTKDFAEILSFAGGYGLRLTIANQYTTQLSTDVWDAVEGNVGTFIVFCVGPKDAQRFKYIAGQKDTHGHWVPVDLANLPKYQALFSVAGQASIVCPTPPPPTRSPASHAQYIQNRMITAFACDCVERSYSPDSVPKPDPAPSNSGNPKPDQGIPLRNAKTGRGSPQHQQQNRPAPRAEKSEPPPSGGKG